MPLFTIQVTKVFDKDAIDCGRPTPLGNPFVMRSEQDRDLVCDQYEEWFNNKIEQKDQAVLNQLRGLFVLGKQRGHLKIGCYCAPKRCHLDTVARFLRNYAEKG